MDSSLTAYCVKCKEKRDIQNAQALYNAKGSPYTKGVCPVCGTALTRFGLTDAHRDVKDEGAPQSARGLRFAPRRRIAEML